MTLPPWSYVRATTGRGNRKTNRIWLNGRASSTWCSIRPISCSFEDSFSAFLSLCPNLDAYVYYYYHGVANTRWVQLNEIYHSKRNETVCVVNTRNDVWFLLVARPARVTSNEGHPKIPCCLQSNGWLTSCHIADILNVHHDLQYFGYAEDNNRWLVATAKSSKTFRSSNTAELLRITSGEHLNQYSKVPKYMTNHSCQLLILLYIVCWRSCQGLEKFSKC